MAVTKNRGSRFARIRMNRSALAAISLALVLLGPARAAWAADPTPVADEEYEKKLKGAQEVSPLGSNFTGEDVSLYDGSTTFSVTDADIPGNNALPVRIGRRLKIIDRHGEGNLPGFGDWDLDLPRIEGTFLSDRGWKIQDTNPYARCSSQALPDVATDGAIVGPRDVWSGSFLYLPGRGEEELLINDQAKLPSMTDGQTHPWVTASFARVSCLSSTATGYPGEAFVAVTPDGTRYTFNYVVTYPALAVRVAPYPGNVADQPGNFSSYSVALARSHVAFLPTTVQDRFGNTVSYHYSGSHLTSITSSDGRSITLSWAGEQITAVTTHAAAPAVDRTWSYTYTAVTNYAYPGTLASVTQPDLSQWTYSAIGTLKPQRREAPLDGGQNTQCPIETDARYDDTGYHLTVGHPSGASVLFDFDYARTYRAHTPIKACRLAWNDPTPAPNPYAAHYWDGYKLTRKTISGPGIATPLQWNYTIQGVAYEFFTTGAATDPCGTCQQSKTSTVTEPDGSYKRYTFGDMYGLNDGKLLKVEQGMGAAAPLSTTTTQYIATDEVAAQRFPDQVGSSRNLVYAFSNRLRPVKQSTVNQDGVNFASTVPSASGVYDFDAYARTLSQLKQSSLGSKTDATKYWDDRNQWVLGQVETTTTDGIQTSRLTYDDPVTDLPTKYYAFGKLQHTLGYNPDGTLSTIKDGNNNLTTLSSWYRGIPRSIQHPATPEVTAGAIESATVDDNGWIRAVTDENGYVTSYGYDAMGRVASIVYPAGDSTVWNATNQTFAQYTAGAEFGIAAGHWKQTISSGNARKVTYFDALMRPVVSQEYDSANAAGTKRTIRHGYDAGGHESFVSYPGTTDGLVTGVHKSYDALDRVTQVDQDSELGLLSTKTRYLSGFKTEVTSPRLGVTTTSFMAFDQPTTNWPVAIVQTNSPEDVYTDISRNNFGKPLSITKHNASNTTSLTRSMIYDGFQMPCKSIEPETGISVSHFDNGNNLDWSAAAQPLNTVDCSDVTSVPMSSRVSRTYDGRNHIRTLDFPDNWSDAAYTYTPDGLVATINVFNDGTNQVATTYNYNKRRLLTGERLQWGSVDWSLGYQFDGNAHLSAQTYPSGLTVGYSPNALGQPTQAGSYATGVLYFPNGAMKQFTYGNGIVHTLDQYSRGLPQRSTDAAPGSTAVLDDSYDFDEDGNVAAISDGRPGFQGDRDMTYDSLDRLLTTTSPMFNGTVATYTYDVLDNLRTVKAPGRNWTYYYDASWRLTNLLNTVSGVSEHGLGYDLQGNLSNKDGVSFTFDMGNRLRSVSGSPSSNYIYDGQGRRVQDVTTGAKRSIYSVGGQLLYDDNLRTGIKSNYIYLNSSLVARDSNTTSLGTPAITVPGTDTTGTFTVQWSTVTSANRYQLQEQYNSGSWALIYDGPGTSQTRTGKPAGTYGYRVRSCVDTTCGAWSGTSNVVESTPTPAPSTAPTITVPATGPNGSYVVSWTSVTGAASYTLEQSANGGAWAAVYSGAALTQSFSGKAAGSYAYRVKACNGTGCGPVSTTGTVQVVYPPTSTPTLTVPATSYTGSYSISWTSVASATSYHVEESVNGGTFANVYGGAALTRSFTGAASGSHTYRSNACNAAGCSSMSATASIQVTYPPTTAPALTTPSTSTTGSYTVSWTAVAAATIYQLYEKVNGGAWTLVQNSAARSRAVSGKPDGTYGYGVKACNVAGCGPLSATGSTVVNIPPPTTPTLMVPSLGTANTAYTVSWSSPSNATSYQLQEKTNGGAWSLVYNGSATSVSRSHPVGAYGYQVKACSAKGCSAFSATQSITVERASCSTCLTTNPRNGGGTGTDGGDGDDQGEGP